MTVREQWDGGEWQVHCCTLLAIRHGEDVQFIPDRVRGDGGMEAYRLDDGVVYQCYAPEIALNTAAQTTAQKGKIRDDIAKLVGKPADTMKLLGDGYSIRRWVLLTPDYDDKELVKYARYKSKKTRDLAPRPPWCHDDFQIVICTDKELFPTELKTLSGMSAGSIHINVPEPDDDEAVEDLGPTLAQRLRNKLAEHPQLSDDPDRLDGQCTDTIFEYVYGKRQLEVLESRYGLAYEAVVRRARSTFRTIRRKMDAGSGGPSDLIDLIEQLTSSFSRDVPALAPLACDELARHYVASWLIDCPLRFRSTAA
ncbi:hypothetical protein CSH63_15490 [Micromonospora tulbaghiae]|uniref:Uncharacterized protein n=1 Tax=Micromonospora tulbaghiae TaxID=479978 RepID=A0A386WQG8_9ACTN|nr:hypothetical protein [Micromonospora tulbaghiae]AYF28834.1 hypothetical protein CSH63_15490 [Micromonospora tulbaghiae]